MVSDILYGIGYVLMCAAMIVFLVGAIGLLGLLLADGL